MLKQITVAALTTLALGVTSMAFADGGLSIKGQGSCGLRVDGSKSSTIIPAGQTAGPDTIMPLGWPLTITSTGDACSIGKSAVQVKQVEDYSGIEVANFASAHSNVTANGKPVFKGNPQDFNLSSPVLITVA